MGTPRSQRKHKRGRDAVTGEFIPIKDAEANPQAIVETVPLSHRCVSCETLGIRDEWTYCPYCGARQRAENE